MILEIRVHVFLLKDSRVKRVIKKLVQWLLLFRMRYIQVPVRSFVRRAFCSYTGTSKISKIWHLSDSSVEFWICRLSATAGHGYRGAWMRIQSELNDLSLIYPVIIGDMFSTCDSYLRKRMFEIQKSVLKNFCNF